MVRLQSSHLLLCLKRATLLVSCAAFFISCKAPSQGDLIGVTGATVAGSTSNTNTTTTAVPADLAFTPSSFAYGNIATNSFTTQTFVVANTSATNSITTGTAVISGAGFTTTSNSCNTVVVSPGGNCSITVKFTPVATTTYTGSLSLPYTEAGVASVISAAVSGIGITPAVAFAFNGFTNTAADYSSVTPSGAVLQWTAQPLASYYKIYSVSGGVSTYLALVSNPNTTSYTLTGLTPNTAYQYKINAFDVSNTSDGNTNLASFTTTNATGANFNGWKDVVATGQIYTSIGNVDTALGNVGANRLDQNMILPVVAGVMQAATVKIAWETFTIVPGGGVTNYRVYRKTGAGGTYADITGTANTSLDVANRIFTDQSVSMETIYYYKVNPVVGVELSTAVAVDTDIKVYVPPKNMSLVHQWMANREMCEGPLAKTFPAQFDRSDNYSCTYTWGKNVTNDGHLFAPDIPLSAADLAANGASYPQARGRHKDKWDIGYSYIVDMFENGCKMSANATMKGAGVPAGGLGSNGDVYQQTASNCYFKKAGAWYGPSSGSLTNAEKATMVTNEPGYYAAAQNQASAYGMCSARSAVGIASMRLPRLEESITIRAWNGYINNPSSANVTIYSNGLDHPTYNSCNIALAQNVPGTNPHYAFGNAYNLLNSGSSMTKNCKSRFELYDTIGNAREWTGDQQVNCNVSNSCQFIGSALDSGSVLTKNYTTNGVIGPAWTGGLIGWGVLNNIYPQFGLMAASITANSGAMASINATYTNQRGVWYGTGFAVQGMVYDGLSGTEHPSYTTYGGRWSYYFHDVTTDWKLTNSWSPNVARCVGEVP